MVQTERVKVLQRNSRSSMAKELIEVMTDYFVQNPNENNIKFTSTHFINAYGKSNETINYCSKVLTSELNKKSQRLRGNNPFYEVTNRNKRPEYNNEEQGRFYVFTRDEINSLQCGEIDLNSSCDKEQ